MPPNRRPPTKVKPSIVKVKPVCPQEQHNFLDKAQHRDFDAVKALVLAAPDLVNAQPSGRWAALHQFVEAGMIEAVKFLLDHGADPRVKANDGKTPADVASGTCKGLLAAAAEAKDKDDDVHEDAGRSMKNGDGGEDGGASVNSFSPSFTMASRREGTVTVNRGQLLTLWITVCLQHLGHSEGDSLHVAHTIAVSCSGWFEPIPAQLLECKYQAPSIKQPVLRKPAAKASIAAAVPIVSIGGHTVGLAKMKDRADPASLKTSLATAFKSHLKNVQAAMLETARSWGKEELRANAMQLYEQFRPSWSDSGEGDLHVSDILAARK